MYAITVDEPGGPEQLQWSQAPTPEPGPGELRIRVQAAGVNRADILQRQGHYPPPAGVTDIIGLEVAGVVDAIGPAVGSGSADGSARMEPHNSGEAAHAGAASDRTPTSGSADRADAARPQIDQADSPAPAPVRVGDEVVALLAGGGYAQYVVAPVGQCAPLPEGIDPTVAAGLMETSATVASNFDHIGLRPGETILIHGGAGGIGSFAIPYAHRLGAQVLTTVGSQAKADYARALGADLAVDYHGDWEAEVKAATGRRGVDAILDIIGAKYLESNLRLLARGGRLVVIGLQGGTKGTLDLNRLLSKAATVTATSLRFRPAGEKAAIVAKLTREVWPLFESAAIPLPPTRSFPMRDARLAHELLESGQNQGKIVLVA